MSNMEERRTIVQVMPAEGWYAAMLDVSREEHEPFYEAEPLIGWALVDDQRDGRFVVGIVANLMDVTGYADEFHFRAEHDYGFMEYVHASTLQDPDREREFARRMKSMLEKATTGGFDWMNKGKR